MTPRFRPILFVATLLFPLMATGVEQAPPEPLEPLEHHGLVAQLVATYVGRMHYVAKELDKDLSQDVFDLYVDNLDPLRMYFTQQDLDELEDVRDSLHVALKSGDAARAFKVFERFRSRVIERAAYAESLLQQAPDLNPDSQLESRDTNSPRVADEAALDALWKKRVNRELVDLALAGVPVGQAQETLLSRYRNSASFARAFSAQDAFDEFINAFLGVMDPDSGYFSPRAKDSVDLEQEGIGLSIEFDGSYPVVSRLLPGGTAEEAGIAAGDRITGIGEPGTEELIDTFGTFSMEQVVDYLRGKPGTTVRLRVLPADGRPGRDDRMVEVERKAISLEAQSANSRLFGVTQGAREWKVGVLRVPSMYVDFAAQQRGDDDYRSVARDARREIEQLKSNGMQALVVDLRNNGGGSLQESAELAGLFIGDRPAGQVVSSAGKVEEIEPKDDDIAWDGPLLLLVNHHSAAGTELFVSAIRDAAAGIVAGKRTYGKATIQNLFDLNRHFPSDIELGNLKLTIGMLYRVSGESFQHQGVMPDIVIESVEEGVRAADNPYALRARNVDDIEDTLSVEPARIAAIKASSEEFSAADGQESDADRALLEAAELAAAMAAGNTSDAR